ncbi:MAG TPA: orotidine-5'-phosphate decarboxylase [Bacillota bacterium]
MAGADRIFVALDVPSRAQALDLVETLAPLGCGFKVGLELLSAVGPGVVEQLAERGLRVFVDAKLHDIPNTVGGAARALAARGAWMITVHVAGGRDMVRAALDGAREGARRGVSPPRVVGVTVLTSLSAAMLSQAAGVERAAEAEVARRAMAGQDWGLDGLVCSPREARGLRRLLGPGPLLVTPGIRPAGSPTGDQQRVAGAAEAIRWGADYLVVGRPVRESAEPAAALAALAAEVAAVSGGGGYP